MIEGLSADEHHLVPKEFGGRKHPIVIIHKVCHNKIHSVLTNRELWRSYNTIELLREHAEIRKFIKWIKKKDPEFMDISRETKVKRNKRRR